MLFKLFSPRLSLGISGIHLSLYGQQVNSLWETPLLEVGLTSSNYGKCIN